MNPLTVDQAIGLARDVEGGMQGISGVDVVVAPPSPFILPVAKVLDHVGLGGQDAWQGDTGPMTGGVSAGQLKELGVTHVIIGHSERRSHASETDAMIQKKLRSVLEHGLVAILCVGERERSLNNGFTIAGEELLRAIEGLPEDYLKNLVIAYEPVWAISTTPGAEPDTPENASRAGAALRSVIAGLYSKEAVDSVRIIYGGSVNEKNIKGFLEEGGMQGVLVGGAGLDPERFLQIIRHAIH